MYSSSSPPFSSFCPSSSSRLPLPPHPFLPLLPLPLPALPRLDAAFAMPSGILFLSLLFLFSFFFFFWIEIFLYFLRLLFFLFLCSMEEVREIHLRRLFFSFFSRGVFWIKNHFFDSRSDVFFREKISLPDFLNIFLGFSSSLSWNSVFLSWKWKNICSRMNLAKKMTKNRWIKTRRRSTG